MKIISLLIALSAGFAAVSHAETAPLGTSIGTLEAADDYTPPPIPEIQPAQPVRYAEPVQQPQQVRYAEPVQQPQPVRVAYVEPASSDDGPFTCTDSGIWDAGRRDHVLKWCPPTVERHCRVYAKQGRSYVFDPDNVDVPARCYAGRSRGDVARSADARIRSNDSWARADDRCCYGGGGLVLPRNDHKPPRSHNTAQFDSPVNSPRDALRRGRIERAAKLGQDRGNNRVALDSPVNSPFDRFQASRRERNEQLRNNDRPGRSPSERSPGRRKRHGD
jgi:hypothetical protein